MITSTTVITDLLISGSPTPLLFAQSVTSSDFFVGFVVFLSALLVAPFVLRVFYDVIGA